MMDARTQITRSAGSEMIGLLLLVPAIAGLFYVLERVSGKASLILADLLPEGTPLPAVTQLTFGFPFLIGGAVLSLLVVVFAFTLRKKDWVQRHMVLLVSAAWFGVGLFVFLTLAGLAITFQTVMTGTL